MTENLRGRLVVLASGGGTNCQALLDACDSGDLEADVVAVVTNRPDAGVIVRAERADVPAIVVEHSGTDVARRRAADAALIEVVSGFDPDLVVLAGWMRILGDEFCQAFRVINLHPALPGAFPGTRAIERAFDAWMAGEIDGSGVMIHWVPDSGVDVGPVIVSEPVPFDATDTMAAFEQRMHEAEHRLIVAGARLALDNVI